jgi:hypothetical protein
MSDKQLVLVTPEVWRAVEHRAALERLTTEAWLARQAAGGSTEDRPGNDENLLDLALRHFRDQGLTLSEQQAVAKALARTLESGETTPVGPVGRRHCHYRVQRRVGSLVIRVGEGALRLPLAPAMRLATLLHGVQPLEAVNNIAA